MLCKDREFVVGKNAVWCAVLSTVFHLSYITSWHKKTTVKVYLFIKTILQKLLFIKAVITNTYDFWYFNLSLLHIIFVRLVNRNIKSIKTYHAN